MLPEPGATARSAADSGEARRRPIRKTDSRLAGLIHVMVIAPCNMIRPRDVAAS
ncbi:hypothetical protein BSY16_4580 (plasmid) [Sinorhizobium sp. RAC02]|nr:hypothetical protein BSY16_4580 [Sinorhizobium sp. RAC02]